MAQDKTKLTPGQKVLCYIREHELVLPGQKLVVAVSGGPDSMCLFHILFNIQKELGIDLHVAHLNHQLRGKESDADAAVVASLARKFGVPATIEARDVNAYRAKHGLSLEESAREVRYSFLAEVAAAVKAERVAVGHTAADHVETVLMHLIRGSGARGMRGLLPLVRWHFSGSEITIVRPLLELTREETTAYCRRHRLHACADASNLSPAYFRNRIRHELLPLLREYNPSVDEALGRTARLAGDDLDFIDGETTKAWQDMVHPEGEAIILEKEKLIPLPKALQRAILRASVEAILGDLKDVEAGHIEALLGALNKPSGKTIQMPQGLTFTIEHDRYVLARDGAADCPFPVLEKEIKLEVPGETALNGWKVSASVLPASEKEEIGQNERFTALFDLDNTGTALTVRHRLDGDRFQPFGLESLKKVNTFMIDARIPRAWRENIPIVKSPEQIIWLAGWRIDERAKVTEKTQKVLRLEFKQI
jgi:tRNA(Ile)-lysidine synthase